MLFALINRDLTDTGKRLRQASVDAMGDVPIAKPYWVPVVEETTDTSTGPNKVTSAWTETVEVARLLRARTIRDKTAGELTADDTASIDSAFSLTGIDRVEMRLIFEVVKAIKTGDATFFDTVTDEPTFKILARSLMR